MLAGNLPHVLRFNLNAAGIGGEPTERQIPPLGAGSDDLHALDVLRESAFNGPIGILNNTS